MLSYIKSAFFSIWLNKGRSVLTVLGVVIGVASVTLLVSIGKGVEKDMDNLVQGFGSNVIMVVGGKLDLNDPNAMSNPASFISGDVLKKEDADQIRSIPGVTRVAPGSLVPGSVRNGEKQAQPTIVASTPDILQAFELLKLEKGRIFSSVDSNEIVLNAKSAALLFGDQDPLGQYVTIGKGEGVPLQVVGVLGKPSVSNSISMEFESMAIIPFNKATELNGRESIFRIFIKAGDTNSVTSVKDAIRTKMLALHGGQEDFTVLTQDDIVGLFGQLLNLVTVLVSAIASISLLVGGIGIMNIMLVTVTERTREIGLRKAVGATRSAIMIQFLIEAIVITLVGGAIGIALAFIGGAVVATRTDLTPSFSLSTIALALGVSSLIGIVFGLWPAERAARKDPIEALRYE